METNNAKQQQAPEAALASLQDEAIEKSLLGGLMAYEGIYLEVRDRLFDDMFYSLKWRDVYRAIKAVGDAGEHPDIVVVTSKLNDMRIASVQMYEVADLITRPSSNVNYYINILTALSSRRKLWQQGMKLASEAMDITKPIDNILADHSKGVEESVFSDDNNSVHTLNEVLHEVSDTILQNQNDATRKHGARTGFKRIDDKGGWQPSNLIIIAADSSQGKSSFALNTAMSAMEGGERVAFYSLEMTREQLVSRILAAQTGIASNSILWDKLTQSDYYLVTNAIADINARIGQSLYFDDKSTSSLEQIVNSIRKQKAKYNISGAVVDYLQILNVNDKSSQSAARKMGDAARTLKNLAKELDIWIVSLSQLSRDRDNPMPSMARLRDSGEIGEAADIVLFIYRPELYGRQYPEPFANKSVQGTAMIEIAKGRNIGLLKFLVNFDAQKCLFYDPVTPIPDTGFIEKVSPAKNFYDEPPF